MSKLKDFFDWICFWKKDFPLPKNHNLSLGEFLSFWSTRLKPVHRAECAVIVYRMDPATAPFPSMKRWPDLPSEAWAVVQGIRDAGMMPDDDWRMDHPEIEKVVFCVRLQRNWKSEYGHKQEEICVSTFEVER